MHVTHPTQWICAPPILLLMRQTDIYNYVYTWRDWTYYICCWETESHISHDTRNVYDFQIFIFVILGGMTTIVCCLIIVICSTTFSSWFVCYLFYIFLAFSIQTLDSIFTCHAIVCFIFCLYLCVCVCWFTLHVRVEFEREIMTRRSKRSLRLRQRIFCAIEFECFMSDRKLCSHLILNR